MYFSRRKDSPPVSEDLSTLVNRVLKEIILIFSKLTAYLEDEISKNYGATLAILACKIMINETVSFDLKSKAGLVFIHCLNVIPQQHCDFLVSNLFNFCDVISLKPNASNSVMFVFPL